MLMEVRGWQKKKKHRKLFYKLALSKKQKNRGH